MAERAAHIGRQARGRPTANVLNHVHALVIIKDIPGPDGLPLMNTPWTLHCDDQEIGQGETDEEGRVHILNALEADKTYELRYPGRSVLIEKVELEDHTSVKGLQQRLMHMGHHPGPIDGVEGPRTRWALMDFQLDHDLDVDGVYGPRSKEKILEVFGS